MDHDNDWTTTGLFSPSKAKAHQAQAKDWAFVDSWLSKRYAKRVPTFERNEDTLQALLSLATLNDAADDQRNSIDRVEKAALQALGKRAENGADGLHHLVLANLTRRHDLDVLAELSVGLDNSRASALEIGTAIIDLNDTEFTTDQQIRRAETQLRALELEQERAKEVLRSLQDEALKAPEILTEQTVEWSRSAKHLRAKIGEYHDRLATASLESKSSTAIDDVAQQFADLQTEESRFQQLESQLQAYQALPSDAKGARSKLESAREDLRHLTNRRDALFEGLADT